MLTKLRVEHCKFTLALELRYYLQIQQINDYRSKIWASENCGSLVKINST